MNAPPRVKRVEHRFVEFVPEQTEPATLYISVEYATVVHSCLCGCGERVVTPLTPTDWHLTYDGETVSLSRSVGNWSFACQSHYWIERSRVHWAGPWSNDKIEANRARDLHAKRLYYEGERHASEADNDRTVDADGGERHGADDAVQIGGGWRRWLRTRLIGR